MQRTDAALVEMSNVCQGQMICCCFQSLRFCCFLVFLQVDLMLLRHRKQESVGLSIVHAAHFSYSLVLHLNQHSDFV